MINKDSVLPMDKICRSCMTEGPEMHSLFEMGLESVQVADMMMACTTVQVNNNFFCYYAIVTYCRFILLVRIW